MLETLEDAERLNASDQQVALLEQAQREGEVSLEVYNEAIDNALRCIRESGFEPYDGGLEESRGFPERFYSVPLEAEAADPVEFRPGATVHRCVAEHSLLVEIAYQNQPSSLEAEEAYRRSAYEAHRDEIVECAEQEGIDVDPNGDILDIEQAVLEALHAGRTDVDCLEGFYGG